MTNFNDYLFDYEKAYIENLSNEEFKALYFDNRQHFDRLIELVHTQTLKRGLKAKTKEDKVFFRYPNRVTAGVFGLSIDAIKQHFKRKNKKKRN